MRVPALALLALAVGQGSAAAPPRQVVVVAFGDSGSPGPRLTPLLHAVRDRPKDAIIALGDLTYPEAPPCPEGRLDGPAKDAYDLLLGSSLVDLGAPVYLAIGNHDRPAEHGPDPYACLASYADRHEDLVFPGPHYAVALEGVTIAVVDTTDLGPVQAEFVRRVFAGAEGWRVLAGHHVLRAFHDKDDSKRVRRWLAEEGLAPDLYLGADAHLLQFGVYGGVPAVVSGATSEPRDQPACPPECGEGQLWGGGDRGYAEISFTPNSLGVRFRGVSGELLWEWSLCRGPAGCLPPAD